jgi:hypothetical protein
MTDPVLRITATALPVLRISPAEGPSLKIEPLYQTGNALRGVIAFCGGKPLDKPGGEWLLAVEAPYNFVARLEGFTAVAKGPALDECVFTAWKDDDQIGEWTFGAGSDIAIPNLMSGSVLKGQIVGIRGPLVPDLDLADIGFRIAED